LLKEIVLRLNKYVFYVALFVLTVFSTSLRALTAADQKEIQQFQLTEDFLHRYEAASAEADLSVKDAETDPKKAAAMLSSLDAITAKVESNPGTVALLARHGLKPREAVVGGIVLMRVAMVDSMLANSATARYVPDKDKLPSEANMAFYRAHKAEITKLIQNSSRNSDDDN
jgi:hypothetical protein